MKGDFSKWVSQRKKNYSGVLHQQGKVLLDSDWNAETQIINDWQDQAGRDIIGPCIAAIPADEPDSFKIVEPVSTKPGGALITAMPGRAWVDGRLVYLDETAATLRLATYLVSAPDGGMAKPHRDAVVLEVWREALNAFQVTDSLIEPALGGPDTTERVLTAMTFRLKPLSADDNCSNLAAKLKDDFTAKGKLKVTLQPSEKTAGDCPVVAAGGYTGFEHRLFRIEIAKVNKEDPGNPRFKWSQFNGGLVGRGVFTDDKLKITITANLQPIVLSGLTSFYLEAVEYDKVLGHSKVVYGGKATLNGDHNLELKESPLYVDSDNGSPKNDFFFRLWDNILPISDFSGDKPIELQDGIFLKFDAANPDSAIYQPEDFWTFSVRAGEIANPETLVGNATGGEPPDGIHYHRAPLAIISWSDVFKAPPDIDDCRHIFRPLTQQNICCTFLVGDGKVSHGDFDSIAEALDQLPRSGGEICLLPGTHETNALISDRQNVTIRGCDRLTRVASLDSKPGNTIFTIQDSQNITIESLEIVTLTGIAIDLIETADEGKRKGGELREIEIRHNRIMAYQHAVRVRGGAEISILDNKIRMLDRVSGDVAIYMAAEDSVIERNDIRMVTSRELPKTEAPIESHDFNPLDSCADFTKIDSRHPGFIALLGKTWVKYQVNLPSKGFTASGGIQIAGTSERIKICENRIIGGAGNGITLGSIPDSSPRSETRLTIQSVSYLDTNDLSANHQKILRDQFEGHLSDLLIADNEVSHMGLNGISVISFLELEKTRLLITIEDSSIVGNYIHDCLQQISEELEKRQKLETQVLNQMGFGGICLADCENLIIQENRIENNGTSHLEPVCGIFILHGEGLDISDNRIVNNAPRRSGTMDRTVPRGRRGGIVIMMTSKQISGEYKENLALNYQDNKPSVKIHDNIVIQPLGQALMIMALGPISITGNHFSTQEIAQSDSYSVLAAAVLIIDLGISKDLLQTPTSQFLGLVGLLAQSTEMASLQTQPQTLRVTQPTVMLPYFYLPNGNVLFANNQVMLDLRSPQINWGLSSQLIFTLDDVSYSSNQSECASLLSPQTKESASQFDFLLTDAILLGATIRTNDCRFQAGITLNTNSLISMGLLMNACTGNQATHCLLTLGPGAVNVNNQVRWAQWCSGFQEYLWNHYQLRTDHS